MWFYKREKKSTREIEPDEIFLDSHNLPEFDVHQFEGRLEKPIAIRTVFIVAVFFIAIGLAYASRLWMLQIAHGEAYAERSEKNRLRHKIFFSERGVVYDRNDILLARNVPNDDTPDFASRVYSDEPGLAHVLGYVKYPALDKSGFYYSLEYSGVAGVEKLYDDELRGKNGLKIIETDALGEIISENIIEPPEPGKNVTLSIDSEVQSELARIIKNLSNEVGFEGGAGALMDLKTGELLALTSIPEFSSDVMSEGEDEVKIQEYLESSQKLFLNRITGGLYTPGSIVKLFIALGALKEKIITPEHEILSTGSISIPNPYDSKKESIFKDWRAHGLVDMRRAIAVSSNVYFFEVGGGYKDQKGLGIEKIGEYMNLFRTLFFREKPALYHHLLGRKKCSMTYGALATHITLRSDNMVFRLLRCKCSWELPRSPRVGVFPSRHLEKWENRRNQKRQ